MTDTQVGAWSLPAAPEAHLLPVHFQCLLPVGSCSGAAVGHCGQQNTGIRPLHRGLTGTHFCCALPCLLGWRIGKGEGYADLEYAMMVSMGAVHEGTPVVTIVHDCQVRPADVPSVPLQLFQEREWGREIPAAHRAMRGVDWCGSEDHFSTCLLPAGPCCSPTVGSLPWPGH